MNEVVLTREAIRHLDRLPVGVRAAALATIRESIAVNPQRAGKALLGDLLGLRSARRGEYRVIYEIREDLVVVHRVQHRRDVYRPR